jgi:hypothetical protein
MPTIKKATIKAYDAITHTATVQVAGSLGVWLSAIRVATEIPAADVVAGRQCTVLFLDPANQDDALVLTIQGALPSTGGGGVTDHGALTGLADDDHPQYGALAQAETVAALWTFSAGLQLAAAQAIKDSVGTDRITPATASPHVTLTGDVVLGDRAAIGGPIDATAYLSVKPTASGLTGTQKLCELGTSGFTWTGNNNLMYGLAGLPTMSLAAASTGHQMYGLNYQPFVGGGGAGTVVAQLTGALVQPGALAYTGAITLLQGFFAKQPFVTSGTPAITLSVGVDIGDYGPTNKFVDAIGLRIADIAAATGFRRLIEAGPATPNLRLEANAPAVSGDSKLLLAFYDGAAVGLRRIVMGAANSGGASFRTLLVAN